MDEKTFEENMIKLKALIKQIQSGELGIDESIEVFKNGMELVKHLEKKLEFIEENAIKMYEENDDDFLEIE